jgi:hypothetical protein
MSHDSPLPSKDGNGSGRAVFSGETNIAYSKAIGESGLDGGGKDARRVIEETPWIGYLVACCLAMALILVGYARLLYSQHHVLFGHRRRKNDESASLNIPEGPGSSVSGEFGELDVGIEAEEAIAVSVRTESVPDDVPIEDDLPSEARVFIIQSDLPSEMMTEGTLGSAVSHDL